MKVFKALLPILALAGAALPLAAQAQVQASLVSTDTSIQPGKPLTVALRLEHESHWHTYWINPGIGLPTELTWSLPQGWTAGAMQWPTPIRIKGIDGEVTGNGYEGVVYFPVTITPPNTLAVGSDAVLKVKATWLMCAESCIPGEADLSLTLPVSVDPPRPNDDVRADLARMAMPKASQNWEVSAARAGNTVSLKLTGLGVIKTPHFFSQDAFITSEGTQQVSSEDKTTTLTMTVAPEAKAGTAKLVGLLSYTDAQGQYQSVSLDVPLGAGAVPAGAGVSTSLLVTLFFAFVGGLILNLMPCVFPVLSIKIVGFVNQAGSDRARITRHGLVFTLGVLLSFWVLAGTILIMRAWGEDLGWGFQLQSPIFVFLFAAALLVFAMSMSGVFEFGLSATGVGSDLQMKDGYAGSFFTGVLATVVATPCTAPFMTPALGAAFTMPAMGSLLVFTFMALGLSAPYLLFSAFPGAVKILPRPGKWMETFKQAMAFPLYGAVGWLIWGLAKQMKDSDFGLFWVLIGLTVIAMGVWLYGRYRAPGNSAGQMRFGLVGGLALLIAGGVIGWPRASKPEWEPWSAARVEELRAEGRPIYVDFTAWWCVTCGINKAVVFGSDEVKQYFNDQNIAKVRADWGDRGPLIRAELAKWNRAAIPFNLVYVPGKEPIPLPEVLTPGIVLDAFKSGAVTEEPK